MVKISCFIRPHRLEEVKSAIGALPITGMSVSDVRGCGNSPEKTAWLGGEEMLIALPVRSKIVVVVRVDLVEDVIEAIIQSARSGEAGDGKIFVEPVLDALRVRTRERGDAAV